jgi:radical SAM protein with 4Fe4S-binding SPASM domain
MGNAVDNPELLLQPYKLLDVMPLLARLYREGEARGLLMVVGNNIGYFGPYEHIWRGFGDDTDHWNGCSAGQTGIGIEADGTIKGCPSLATSLYAAGNVRDMTVADIWRHSEKMRFGRLRDVEELWGYCRTCYYADVCRAGCTWTSESLLGKRGNNPYCHHRALDLAKPRPARKRVVKIKDAPARKLRGRRIRPDHRGHPRAPRSRPCPIAIPPRCMSLRASARRPAGPCRPASSPVGPAPATSGPMS